MRIEDKDRLDYLDSIRGIAAVMVLVYHVICSHWDWTKIGKIGKIFFNGSGAVAMFFVLSGLVLSLKLIRNNVEISASFMNQFLIKRILRLYPAFLFSLIFYIFLQYNSTSVLEVFEEALLIRGRHTLYLPDWTLGVEMALSLFVPFMVLFIRKSEKLFVWFIVMTLLVGGDYISEYVLLFGFGILISNRFNEIQDYNIQEHWLFKYKLFLAPLLLLLFSYQHIYTLVQWPSSIHYFFDKLLNIGEHTFSGIASFIVLIYVINSKKLKSFLSNTFLVFIGKISYGIYLSHWFFTKLVMNNFDFVLSNYAGGNKQKFFIIYLLFTLVGSILSGWFIYKFIEIPFIKISKKLVKNIFASKER